MTANLVIHHMKWSMEGIWEEGAGNVWAQARGSNGRTKRNYVTNTLIF